MQIDWKYVENTIVATAKTCIEEFAAEHPDEVFYGFFLDCNASYFETLGHFNTEALLHEQALNYQEKHAELYPGWSVAQLEDHLRWSAGDWGYFEVFNPCDYDEEYGEFVMQAIEHYHATPSDERSEPSVYDEFLQVACVVALRLAAENTFQALHTTKDFRVLCVDHDESIEDGERRLQAVLKSLQG